MNDQLIASEAAHHGPIPGHYDTFADESAPASREEPEATEAELRANAAALVEGWEVAHPAPAPPEKMRLPQRLHKVEARLKTALQSSRGSIAGKGATPQIDLLKNRRLLENAIASVKTDLKQLDALPHVHIAYQGELPRVVNLAEAYMSVAGGIWSPASLSVYLQQAQLHHSLLMDEILQLPQALKFAQLEYILDRADEAAHAANRSDPSHPAPGLAHQIHSMERLNQYEWRPLLESLIPFDSVLRMDPGGTYAAMDDETRHAYRHRVAVLAHNADCNEFETASAAIAMAREAQRAGDPNPRCAERKQHVGYFLFAEGAPALERRIGYHPPPAARIRRFLRRYNEDFYIDGIIVLSLLLMIPIIAPIVPHNDFWLVMFTLLLALLPVTQGAVDLVNGIVQSLLKAEALHKIDYAKGVPAEATTLVVVPTLLLREDQVKELFEDLEGRYLSNEDPNIHFALLTDLPDSRVRPPSDETHPLVQMAIRYTQNLDRKYADGKGGRFLLLHRHRVFNQRQGVWMGWERKRGKLLDLNKLLLHEYDSFPIKAGPLSVLERVRYVITLDSDTKLPYGAAQRMIGTITHPLNRAIVSPRLGIVTVGYGLLQPRVGVSVSSASRSRLAALYSGETGFDIYARAISDVYQDLFGEGIFTGKGIYEVGVFHRVLERRFPRNSLLSHDLIEGAYVRAGLVSDVEVIDDYPSQYHAHTRRQHRWIRGDWQIMRWLFSPVPDESGRLVPNPISLISRWKIVDNLRRSLVEPVTFLVLVFGWFFFPGAVVHPILAPPDQIDGPLYWTLVTIGLLLLPALVQLGFDLGKAILHWSPIAAREAAVTFTGSLAVALLHLTFLAHQMLLSIDAIVRSLNRTYYSGRHLLEWETAAQVEHGAKRNSLDRYLQLSPIIAILLAAGLALRYRPHPYALLAAGPVLFLWTIAPFAAAWLNSPPRRDEADLHPADQAFLEDHALRIWRFYADFAGPDNHFLIPDHVEEQNLNQVRMITPTNLGMLFNARQAAVEFGWLTLPEFAHATLGSLDSFERLEKYRGHIYNWYDLVTLRPILPIVVSTVDSGNLAASLYTLRSGVLDLLQRPLLASESFRALERIPAVPRHTDTQSLTLRDRIDQLFALLEDQPAPISSAPGTPHDSWLPEELSRRRAALATLIETHLPWLLPEFAPLTASIPQMNASIPSAEQAPDFIRRLSAALDRLAPNSPQHDVALTLQSLLRTALDRTSQLHADLKAISDRAERFAEQMDFSFLYVESRMLLSNGFDLATRHLHTACFDLLATEARTAAFLAVAKGDIPQRSWFRLDRAHLLVKGRAVLLSWTATMFEHLMPTLWMQAYPDTLLTNSLDTVVQIQIDHVRRMPWGISESGFIGNDENANYSYHAWGLPEIALKYDADDGPVIAPYATFLALPLRRNAALANLRRMASMGWIGDYGFYEAADYRDPQRRSPRLVRSWMAHHQGMSLLAITNLLCDGIVCDWFHANPRVRAAEQLLHEKPLTKQRLKELARQPAAA